MKREEKQKRREERRRQRRLLEVQKAEQRKKIAEERKRQHEVMVEERKLLIAQRQLESIRLLSAVFERLKVLQRLATDSCTCLVALSPSADLSPCGTLSRFRHIFGLLCGSQHNRFEKPLKSCYSISSS